MARTEDDWQVVEVVGTEEEAALIAGFLESRGLPCRIESLRFHQEPVNFGRLGEVRVRVPAERLEEARSLLAQRRSRFDLVHAAGEADDAEPDDGPEDAAEEEPA
jgi:hypothetical protein